MNCSEVPFAIDRLGAVTAIETKVGWWFEDGENAQLDINTIAQSNATTVLPLRVQCCEPTILRSPWYELRFVCYGRILDVHIHCDVTRRDVR